MVRCITSDKSTICSSYAFIQQFVFSIDDNKQKTEEEYSIVIIYHLIRKINPK